MFLLLGYFFFAILVIGVLLGIGSLILVGAYLVFAVLGLCAVLPTFIEWVRRTYLRMRDWFIINVQFPAVYVWLRIKGCTHEEIMEAVAEALGVTYEQPAPPIYRGHDLR